MNGIRNSVQLIGYIGKDPDIKYLEDGKAVINFSLATNETYKNQKGEKVQQTYWHNIVAWGKLAEMMNGLLKKGSEVAVQGKLTYKSYEDKEGVTRHVPQIVVEEFLLIK